ncbi:MAG: EamA family transporter [Rhabdochlamydiaceae bacterium]|nr:EamA family transporter [Rhabdochlamydiaceae bacterium]
MLISLVVALYAIWSSTFSIGKMALAFSPPVFLTGFRMFLAGMLLLGYLVIAKRSSFQLKMKQWGFLFILGFFSVYLTNILEFWGLQYLSAAKASFIYSLSPFFSALFSYIHFGEKMNRRKWLGLGIGFVGFVPVLLLQTGSEDLLSVWKFLSLPSLALMGAALAGVYGWVLLRLAVKQSDISPFMANGTSMFLGGAMALVHSFFVDSWNPIPIAQGHVYDVTKIVLILTFLSNIVCYNLYGMMLKRYTATFLSFMGLLSPIFASLTGWVLLGEPISWTIFCSTAVVSMGLWIVYKAELKQGYIVRKQPEQELS